MGGPIDVKLKKGKGGFMRRRWDASKVKGLFYDA
jgi:hypothetical protein